MTRWVDHQKYAFEDRIIAGVRVFGFLAFEDEDAWEADLIGRAIPDMGEKYIKLFIDCKFNVYIFLQLAEEMDDN